MQGWIGVDLDGTLAQYDGWKGELHIGPPIPAMVERVREWLRSGQTVKIMTARVSCTDPEERAQVVQVIERWCFTHLDAVLEVTCQKDYSMIELWDDRAIHVAPNTGIPVPGQTSRVRGLT